MAISTLVNLKVVSKRDADCGMSISEFRILHSAGSDTGGGSRPTVLTASAS